MVTSEGVDQLIPGNDSIVQCSICLEAVACDALRSIVKLQCGHEFHLDCIGSAFNVKGIMQCPNCRNIEKGQWMYAVGSSSSTPDFSMDTWTAENYPFLLVPYGFHICPIRGIMPGTGSSVVSLVAPPAHGVVRPPHPVNRHPHFMGVPGPFIPGARRFNGPRGLSTLGPAAGHPSDPRASGSYYPPPFAPSSYNFHATGQAPVPSPSYSSHGWGRDRIHHFLVMPPHDQWLRIR